VLPTAGDTGQWDRSDIERIRDAAMTMGNPLASGACGLPRCLPHPVGESDGIDHASSGIDLDDRPPAGQGLEGLRTPELCRVLVLGDVPGRSASRCVPCLQDRPITATEDLHHGSREAGHRVTTLIPPPHRLKDGTAPHLGGHSQQDSDGSPTEPTGVIGISHGQDGHEGSLDGVLRKERPAQLVGEAAGDQRLPARGWSRDNHVTPVDPIPHAQRRSWLPGNACVQDCRTTATSGATRAALAVWKEAAFATSIELGPDGTTLDFRIVQQVDWDGSERLQRLLYDLVRNHRFDAQQPRRWPSHLRGRTDLPWRVVLECHSPPDATIQEVIDRETQHLPKLSGPAVRSTGTFVLVPSTRSST
jgi:hypothetical protein